MATSIPTRSSSVAHNFKLQYAGKKANFRLSDIKPANLENITQIGGRSPNRLVFGENLHVLAALLSDKTVAGKVDMIYIDPPYATGGVFIDRDQGAAYSDIIKGNEFVEFLRIRLILAKELLSNCGSIFVHLDERFVFHAKIVMDEIFGAANFRNMIVRRKCNSKNYTVKRLGNTVDYVLWYTKSDKYMWNRPLEPLTDDFIDREYTYFDKETGRRYKRVPLHAPGVRRGETGQPWRGKLPPAGKHWQYPPRVIEEMDKNGDIYWSKNGNPRRKVYLDQSKGNPLQDVWLDVKDAHNQNVSITGYPTEKNLLLVERLVLAASKPGSLVMDFFCGSGTLAEAANKHGRSWICVDRSDAAIRASAQRLIRGKRLMGDFVGSKFRDNDFLPPLPAAGWSLWADLRDTGLGTPNELKKWLQAELENEPNSSSTPWSDEDQRSSA